jgi:hypothetical protein
VRFSWRRLSLVIAAVSVVPLAPVRSAAVAAAIAPSTPADPEIGPLIAGTSSYVHGTYVWTDYVYDDRGTNKGQPGTRSPNNAGDLVQLQLSRVREGLHIRAILETLVDPKAPVLGVAFDTDDDPKTGAPLVPGWAARGALGVDRLAVIRHGTSGVVRFADGQWSSAGHFPSRIDVSTNVIEATIPSEQLPKLSGTWRVFGMLGVADAAGHAWPEGGAISDLAFVGGEIPDGWQDARQAAVLGGMLDSAAAAATVDIDALGRDTTRLASATAPGFHTLLYHSRLRLGEGIGQATLTVPGTGATPVGDLFAGPYQPYLVYVPPHLPEHPPVVLFMHGFTQTHLSNAGFFGPAPISTNGVTIPMAGNVVGHFNVPGAVVVSPLGRGGNTFYIGAAEQDVLDAVDDAIARYHADPDRVVLSGVSMGGFGTFRLAVRRPDRWSVAVPIIGTGASDQSVFGDAVPRPLLASVFSPYGFPGGQAELLENVVNLPMRLVNGQLDPLVDNALSTADVVALDRLGYDYRSWVLLRRHHEFDPSFMNCVLVDAVRAHRETHPARVVFSVEPAIERTDPSSGLDLTYDRAYWVSEVRPRPDVPQGDKASLSVTSLARADRAPSATHVVGAGQNLTGGADLCGPNAAVHSGDAWRELGIALGPGLHQRVSNGVTVSLSRIAHATIDVGDAGLRTDRALTVVTSGDGASTVVLRGPWPSRVSVWRDGEAIGMQTTVSGRLALPGDLRGRHTYVLRPTS